MTERLRWLPAKQLGSARASSNLAAVVATIAQLGERQTEDLKVIRSIRVCGKLSIFRRGVAQRKRDGPITHRSQDRNLLPRQII